MRTPSGFFFPARGAAGVPDDGADHLSAALDFPPVPGATVLHLHTRPDGRLVAGDRLLTVAQFQEQVLAGLGLPAGQLVILVSCVFSPQMAAVGRDLAARSGHPVVAATTAVVTTPRGRALAVRMGFTADGRPLLPSLLPAPDWIVTEASPGLAPPSAPLGDPDLLAVVASGALNRYLGLPPGPRPVLAPDPGQRPARVRDVWWSAAAGAGLPGRDHRFTAWRARAVPPESAGLADPSVTAAPVRGSVSSGGDPGALLGEIRGGLAGPVPGQAGGPGWRDIDDAGGRRWFWNGPGPAVSLPAALRPGEAGGERLLSLIDSLAQLVRPILPAGQQAGMTTDFLDNWLHGHLPVTTREYEQLHAQDLVDPRSVLSAVTRMFQVRVQIFERGPDPQAPGPDAPVVEAPVVEAPVVEAPVVEAPVVEAPVVEAPVAGAPGTGTIVASRLYGPARDQDGRPTPVLYLSWHGTRFAPLFGNAAALPPRGLLGDGPPVVAAALRMDREHHLLRAEIDELVAHPGLDPAVSQESSAAARRIGAAWRRRADAITPQSGPADTGRLRYMLGQLASCRDDLRGIVSELDGRVDRALKYLSGDPAAHLTAARQGELVRLLLAGLDSPSEPWLALVVLEAATSAELAEMFADGELAGAGGAYPAGSPAARSPGPFPDHAVRGGP